MYKLLFAVLKLVFVVSIFLFCLKIGLYKHALQQVHYIDTADVQQYSNNSTSRVKESQILKHLEDLTAVPLLGRLYQQQKIVELYRLHRFEDALTLLNQMLQSPFKQKSFKLWYLKAETEISLNLLEEGQLSLTKASMYAKKKYQNSLIDSLEDMLSKNKEIKTAIQNHLEDRGIYLKKSEVEAYLEEKERRERQNL